MRFAKTRFLAALLSVGLLITTHDSSFASKLMDDYSHKSVAEVLELLENTNPDVRVVAAMSLGFRYRMPGPVVNPPTWVEQQPEFPLPGRVVPALAAHLKSDPDFMVRLAAVDALSDLRFQTNTTPVIVSGLDDRAAWVRLHACNELVCISHEYSEPLDGKVLDTLTSFLRPDGDTETAWYAAWTAGQLGKDGAPLIPALERTKKSKSPKVRGYAKDALAEIRKATRHH